MTRNTIGVVVHAAAIFLMLAGAPRQAEAHYLWIETQTASTPSPKVRVYYGEFEEGLRETAGGRLDEVGTIQASVSGPGNSSRGLVCEKRGDHFEATIPEPLEAGYALVQLQELGRPVKDWRQHNIGIVKPNFYASALMLTDGRHVADFPETGPANRTVLGIYPVHVGGELVLQVFFRDQALSKAKVNVHAPNGWSKELITDEGGRIRLTPPWPGQYVFEVIHLEKTPGAFQGVVYEAIRHRATFTWQTERTTE